MRQQEHRRQLELSPSRDNYTLVASSASMRVEIARREALAVILGNAR
jgi:hypothetical protein